MNVPEIQFRQKLSRGGYDSSRPSLNESWKLQTFGNTSVRIKSYSLSRKFETKEVTNVKYIHYGDIHKFGDGIITDSNDLPSIKIKDASKYVHLSNGDLVLADASEDYSEIAKPFLLEVKDINKVIVISGLHTIAVRLKKNDPLFMYYLFNTDIFKHFGYRHGTGLKVFGISYNELAKFKFYVPGNIDEQKEIGIFLKKLDYLIQLQWQKLDKLKQLKQGYLQKIYPKSNRVVPNLRFDGFKNNWRKYIYDNLLKDVNEKSTVKNQYEELSSTNNGIENKSGRVKSKNNIGSKILRKNELVLSPQNLWLGNININFKFENGLVSSSYKIYKIINIDILFFNGLIKLPQLMWQYKVSSVQGASVVRRNLDLEAFMNISILVPNITEQHRIGSFLSNIDKLINLQSKKLRTLKKLKQGYLQKMFC